MELKSRSFTSKESHVAHEPQVANPWCRVTQLETEGNISLARERDNMMEQCREKRKKNEGSTESSTKMGEPWHKKKGRWKELSGRKDVLPHSGRTIITSREGHLETTNSTRGEYPPLFPPDPQIER
ncbi:hypothetical protein TNCV_1521191 [Trichonephila clavipes]|nr:hypothetical protein TNCV_1521191 [Trichonephila clavipes]